MSIEHQLAEAFKRNNESLKCPPSLDASIMAQYRVEMVEKKGTFVMKRKVTLWKSAIVALLVVVLSGFAYGGTKLLYSNSEGNVKWSIHSSESLQYTQEELDQLRAKIKAVENQLAPGQLAAVYLPEALKQLPGIDPLIGVSKPAFITNFQEWKRVLEQAEVAEYIPDQLLDGEYQFVKGAISNTNITFDSVINVEELKAEYENKGNTEPVWILTEADPSLDSYTSVYQDSHGELIQLNVSLYKDTVKLDGYISSTSEYDNYELNGHTVHYTENTQFLFGDSSFLQTVSWQQTNGDIAVIYSLNTHSPDITKEQLLEVAESLLKE